MRSIRDRAFIAAGPGAGRRFFFARLRDSGLLGTHRIAPARQSEQFRELTETRRPARGGHCDLVPTFFNASLILHAPFAVSLSRFRSVFAATSRGDVPAPLAQCPGPNVLGCRGEDPYAPRVDQDPSVLAWLRRRPATTAICEDPGAIPSGALNDIENALPDRQPVQRSAGGLVFSSAIRAITSSSSLARSVDCYDRCSPRGVAQAPQADAVLDFTPLPTVASLPTPAGGGG